MEIQNFTKMSELWNENIKLWEEHSQNYGDIKSEFQEKCQNCEMWFFFFFFFFFFSELQNPNRKFSEKKSE